VNSDFETELKSGAAAIFMDSDEHRSYRAVTNDWFKPTNLRRTFQLRIRELAKLFVDRMAELGGECDFASEVACFYPLRVIMSILGVPEEDEPLMLSLTQRGFSAEDPDFAGQSDAQTLQWTVTAGFSEYFKERIPIRYKLRPSS
jgi:cytochrome P450